MGYLAVAVTVGFQPVQHSFCSRFCQAGGPQLPLSLGFLGVGPGVRHQGRLPGAEWGQQFGTHGHPPFFQTNSCRAWFLRTRKSLAISDRRACRWPGPSENADGLEAALPCAETACPWTQRARAEGSPPRLPGSESIRSPRLRSGNLFGSSSDAAFFEERLQEHVVLWRRAGDTSPP